MRKIALLVGLSLALVMACDDDSGFTAGSSGAGGSEATPCNEDPSVCPAGQTCWFTDEETSYDFTCLNSGVSTVGETCLAALGMPTCTDGLMCFMQQGQPSGVCTEWCNPNDSDLACPASRQCMWVGWQHPQSGQVTSGYICDPPATGTGGSGGSGGSGTGGSGTGGSGTGGSGGTYG